MGKRLTFETEEEKKEHKKKLRQAAKERSAERHQQYMAERAEENKKWEEQHRQRQLKEGEEGHRAIPALVAELISEIRDRRIPACKVWVEKPRTLEEREAPEAVTNPFAQLSVDLHRKHPREQYDQKMDEAEQLRREATLAQLQDQLAVLEAYQHPAWPEDQESQLKVYRSVHDLYCDLRQLKEKSAYLHEYRCFMPTQ